MPALRAADRPLRRHVPQLRLQDLAVERDGLRRIQGVAGRRSEVSRFDVDYPARVDNTVDYVERAHHLGIHIFPNSNWPFVICLGVLFLSVAAIPFPATTRIVLAAIGGVIFLWGVVGWVLVEDVKMFPDDSAQPQGEVHN
jgi:hypothetical protein